MQSAVTLTLSGLCIGIALSGLLGLLARSASAREKVSIGLVYGTVSMIVALPFVKAAVGWFIPYYMPAILVMLLLVSPAIYHFVLSKTQKGSLPAIPRRDFALPIAGSVICIGFWLLPANDKATLFIEGQVPNSVLPAALALLTFVLLICWLCTSCAYLIAAVRQLGRYRFALRQLHSNLDGRELRWIDYVIILLVTTWAAAAWSLAHDNLGSGALVYEELLLILTALTLLGFTAFAPYQPPALEQVTSKEAPDPKYLRSALTQDHAARLAKRIEDAMRKEALYLNPNLSLQKLSQRVGAVPNQVSQTLNQEIGLSFFDYVAQWRVKAAEPLIVAGDQSVLSIALQVGFNSKSTFYKAFKRETGMTPKAYRDSKN